VIYFPFWDWLNRQYRYLRYDCFYIPDGASRKRVGVWLGSVLVIAAPIILLGLPLLYPYPIAQLSVGGILMIVGFTLMTRKNKDADKERKVKEKTEAWWRGEIAWYKFF
jgi:predicted membrane protein